MANPSRIFILRPVATTLLMLAIFLLGLLTYRFLAVSALPEIDYPTIQVVTLYPGASPEVVSSGITAPLERQLGKMSGLEQMSSQSGLGVSLITLRFALHMNLDVAEQEVQAEINSASAFLPNDLPSPPVYNKVNPADAPILTLAVSSATLPLPNLQDLVETRLTRKLSQVSGVGLVSIAGGQRPAVRIHADSQKLASFALSLEDVRLAIIRNNVNLPKGSLDGSRALSINANDQLQSVDEYKQLIISYVNNSPVRLQDVALVKEGTEDYRLAAWYNEQSAIIVTVQRQPGANIISVVDEIKFLLPELQKMFPGNTQIEILSDRTVTTRATISDVQWELFFAISLVVAIVFIFLQNLRMTIIPSVAVPLSLIGTFGIMYLLNYSVNNLTLMALTIATGFVIDDAIVVTENISRYLEQGKKPLEAALLGSEQIAFTIISLTLSLVAVLIPLFFMTDIVGRLFREFAVTLASAILLSAFISLSLTPMMCAYFLGKGQAEKKESTLWTRFVAFYSRTLDIVFLHQKMTLLLAVLLLVATVVMYFIIPKGFFPIQDTGIIQVFVDAKQDIAFELLAKKQQEVNKKLLDDPAVLNTASFVGVSALNTSTNVGRLTMNILPVVDRKESLQELISHFESLVSDIPGINVYFQPVQDLTIEDVVTQGQYHFILEALTQDDLKKWVAIFIQSLQKRDELRNISSDLRYEGVKLQIAIDRDRAASLGVDVRSIGETLYNAFGQRMVSTIFTQTNQYRVVLDTQKENVSIETIFDTLYVKGKKGLVPLRAVSRIEEKTSPVILVRDGQFPAAHISFDLSSGSSLSAAIQAIKEVEESLQLPETVSIHLQGATKAFSSSLRDTLWLIIAAVIAMYIVLGILYEHFIHPLTILSTLPSAALGALLSLYFFHMDLGIVGVIGIILLIGIVKKNGIMMVDFALDAERNEGKTPQEAMKQACLLRLRPILMTTFAAVFGALPLLFGGMGSELRLPLGVTMIGGLLLSQVLTLYTTPVIYLRFTSLVDKYKKR